MTKIVSSKYLFPSAAYKEPVVTCSAGDVSTAAIQRQGEPPTGDAKENKNAIRELINLEHEVQQNLELDVRAQGF